jgi:hypothetical protein
MEFLDSLEFTVDMGAHEFAPETSATLSATTLNFSNQDAGTISPPSAITLTNTGSATLVVRGVSVTGEFSQTNTCQSALGVRAGDSCTINVRFAPTAGGSRAGQLTLDSNSSLDNVSLSGNGSGPLTISANPLVFGGQKVGTTSPVSALQISNSGTGDTSLSFATTAGDFGTSNDCPAPLPQGSACTLNVQFGPTAMGMRFAAITITSSATGSSHVIMLSGLGLQPGISIDPTSVSFGTQNAGSTTSRIVSVANSGTMALAINSISVTGDYTATQDCPGRLSPRLSAQSILFSSQWEPVSRNGVLTISDNAPGGPHTVALDGSGTGPVFDVQPAPVWSFGNQPVNTTSATKNFTIRNVGNTSMTITGIVASGDFAFSQSGTCTTLSPFSSVCTLSVTFTPTSAGPKAGAVTITHSALGSPHSVQLTGTGVEVAFSPASLAFGDVHTGATATQTVTLTNNSSSVVSIAGITVPTGFSQQSACGSTLGAGMSCLIDVTFAPTLAGSVSGVLVRVR